MRYARVLIGGKLTISRAADSTESIALGHVSVIESSCDVSMAAYQSLRSPEIAERAAQMEEEADAIVAEKVEAFIEAKDHLGDRAVAEMSEVFRATPGRLGP